MGPSTKWVRINGIGEYMSYAHVRSFTYEHTSRGRVRARDIVSLCMLLIAMGS
jgi:hypothetical protein